MQCGFWTATDQQQGREQCEPAPPAHLGLGRIVASRHRALINFIPDSRIFSVPLYLKRQCGRNLRPPRPSTRPSAARRPAGQGAARPEDRQGCGGRAWLAVLRAAGAGAGAAGAGAHGGVVHHHPGHPRLRQCPAPRRTPPPGPRQQRCIRKTGRGR